LRAWYVPTEDTTSQARVPYERVAFLDAPPSDRQYRVIGYICPPVGKFHSWGERLNATRAAASLYGADAVYIDQQSEGELWSFKVNQWGGGGSGGKYKDVHIRAVAIAYE